jgi:murein DD-endopeptidase MepM/ murein hydrolase activator NlpD
VLHQSDRSPESLLIRTVFYTVLWTLFVGFPPAMAAQSEIVTLTRDDPVYRQHQELVAQYYRAATQGDPLPPPFILVYQPARGETLFEIASRLMVPYSAISTLNRLEDTRIDQDAPLLIPSRPGLFVYDDPQTPLEERLFQRFSGVAGTEGQKIRLSETSVPVTQYAGTDFLPEERRLFLRIFFDDPLPLGMVSSRYGYRYHPITGVWVFHYGLDIAGNFGDSVRTAAAGRVISIERDPWLGLSVTVEHVGDYITRYAHLQEAFVQEGTYIERNGTIGSVGSTGFSTGPHLHFEVLHQGSHENPEKYLLREGR